MKDLYELLTQNSPFFIIMVLVLVSTVFVLKLIFEKSLSTEFDKYKKSMELKLKKRSRFDEKILLDRYNLIRDIQARQHKVLTIINRIRHGIKVDNFIIQNEPVQMTEVYELLALNKIIITLPIHDKLIKQADLIMKIINDKAFTKREKFEKEYLTMIDDLNSEMNKMFGLDKIKWDS
jgi:hypothetical protein